MKTRSVEIGSHVFSHQGVGGDAALLAAFFAQREPSRAPAAMKIAHPHADESAHPDDIVEHHTEQRPISARDQIVSVEQSEKASSLLSFEHWRFALMTHDAYAAHHRGGV